MDSKAALEKFKMKDVLGNRFSTYCPILIILSIVSPFPVDNYLSHRNEKLCFYLKYLWQILFMISTHFNVLLSLATLFVGSRTVSVPSWILKALLSAYTADMLVYERKKLWTFIHILEDKAVKIVEESKVKIQNSVKMATFAGCFCYISCMLSVLFALHFTSAPEWTKNYMNTKRVQEYLIPGIIFHVLVINGNFVFVPVLLIAMCSTLNEICKMFIRDIRSTSIFKLDDIVRLKTKHLYIRNLVLTMNDIFSSIVFLWFIVMVFGSCTDTALIISKTFPVAFLVSVGLYYFPIVLLFCYFSYKACQMNETFKRIVPLMQELELEVDGHDIYCELLLLQHQVSSPEVGLNAHRCFVVNRKFFFSLIGVIVTYGLVIIQMNPLIHAKSRHFVNATDIPNLNLSGID